MAIHILSRKRCAPATDPDPPDRGPEERVGRRVIYQSLLLNHLSPRGLVGLRGLQASSNTDKILATYKGEPRLPASAAKDLREACWQFALCQSALVQFYHPNIALYNQTIKTHMLLHIALCAEFIHPGIAACWAGEDMMRVVRKLGASTAHGSSKSHNQVSAMEKYAMALDFEFGIEGTWFG